MPGHHAGLYLPADLPDDLSQQTLLVVEGGSDAVAALDLGFWPAARFSCTHGGQMLTSLARQRRPKQIVVCADTGNQHELRGAERLVEQLVPYARSVRLIAPPPPHKDLRAWCNTGATSHDLCLVIEAAHPHQIGVKCYG